MSNIDLVEKRETCFYSRGARLSFEHEYREKDICQNCSSSSFNLITGFKCNRLGKSVSWYDKCENFCL